MDVKKTKQQTDSDDHSFQHTNSGHKWFMGSYILLLLVSGVLYFLLRLDVFHALGKYQLLLQKILLGFSLASIVLIILQFLIHLLKSKTQNKSARYNIVRLLRFVAALVIAGIFTSIFFANWYTAAVSLGLISLILGFALQTPISSLIGWVYIIIRAPYHIGDRIQVGDFTGDVVEISYLDTTLWEFAGDYLTNDLPSGRLIRFPNSMVFSNPVYNYSWKKFPYIWNEIPLHVAYESDLEFVEATIRQVAREELGPDMMEHVKEYKDLLRETPVDEFEIKEYPFIALRINANTWVEVLLVYLVKPKEASAIRSRLIRKMIEALLQQPEKVMFPKSNAR